MLFSPQPRLSSHVYELAPPPILITSLLISPQPEGPARLVRPARRLWAGPDDGQRQPAHPAVLRLVLGARHHLCAERPHQDCPQARLPGHPALAAVPGQLRDGQQLQRLPRRRPDGRLLVHPRQRHRRPQLHQLPGRQRGREEEERKWFHDAVRSLRAHLTSEPQRDDSFEPLFYLLVCFFRSNAWRRTSARRAATTAPARLCPTRRRSTSPSTARWVRQLQNQTLPAIDDTSTYSRSLAHSHTHTLTHSLTLSLPHLHTCRSVARRTSWPRSTRAARSLASLP